VFFFFKKIILFAHHKHRKAKGKRQTYI